LIYVNNGLVRNPGDPASARYDGQSGELGRIDVDQMGRHFHDQTLDTSLEQSVDSVGNTPRRQVRHRRQGHGVAESARLVLKREDPSRWSKKRRSQGQHTNRVTALPR